MDNSNILISNLNKLHTTKMGIDRIKRNLELDVEDVVYLCKEKINKENSLIYKRGKNWYIEIDGVIITVNAHSYTIITAHKMK